MSKTLLEQVEEEIRNRVFLHNRAEAQIEVLREGLQTIIDDHCCVPNCSCCDADVETAQEALANLPVSAAAVEKVLEAADEFEQDWTSVQGGDWRTRMQILVEAVRQWRRDNG